MSLILLIIIIPILTAPVAYLIGRKEESRPEYLATGVCTLILAAVIALAIRRPQAALCLIPRTFFSFDPSKLHLLYGLITAFMWFATAIFSREYFSKEREHLGRYWMFMLITLSATEGVMLSADFMTAFVFFEILSFTSFTWVIHEETGEAVRAAYTYLFIAVFGGMVLFAGLALLQHAAGTLSFAKLPSAIAACSHPGYVMAAGICILFGFGAKAGMFPLHVWLPMAHPVAPSPASALLSGILTKVGIYGILMAVRYVLCDSEEFAILIFVLALITMATGALLALFSVNLKRTLACSSMSQIGFILSGIAMMEFFGSAGETKEVEAAFAGVALHMINHSMIKLVLFMAAGVVVMRLGALRLDEIRGWGRNKKALKLAFGLGALGISGVPLFGGYVSKTLLHEAITEGSHVLPGVAALLKTGEWVFIVSGGLTFAYMLKLFICLFCESNSDTQKQESFNKDASCMNNCSAAVILFTALLMPLLGQPPIAGFFAGICGDPGVRVAYGSIFSLESLLGGGLSLLIGAGVYLLIVRKLLIKDGSYVTLRQALGRADKESAAAKMFAGFFKGAGTVLSEAVKLIAYGLDAPVDLLKYFLSAEQNKNDRHTPVYGLFSATLTSSRDEAHPISEGFSFALMMTCIGILIILFVLVFTVL